jgi:hypothetical protein
MSRQASIGQCTQALAVLADDEGGPSQASPRSRRPFLGRRLSADDPARLLAWDEHWADVVRDERT